MQDKKIWFLAGISFLIGAVATAVTMQCSAWFIGALTAWIWIKLENTPSTNAVKRGALAGILGAGHIVFIPIITMYTNPQGFKWQEAWPAAITALTILVLNSLLGAAAGYFLKKRMEKPPSEGETQTPGHSKWLRITLIAGSVIGIVCFLGVGAYWFFARTMNNIAETSSPWVRSLAWAKGGSKLFVGSADHTVTYWDVKSAKLVYTGERSASVRDIALSPDEMMLAIGEQTGGILIWYPATGDVEQLAKEYEQESLGFLAWSPDGSQLAYTGDKGKIMIWDVAHRQKTVFAQSKNGITGISWSPDGTRLATSSIDGTVSTWDLQTSQSIWIVDAHKGWANDVDWAPDGSLLASGGDDGQLKIWDTETGKLVNQISGSDEIFSVAWSPKANHIAWESAAGQVAISDFEKPDIHLNAGTDQVWVVAWSQDGQQLAAGTSTNTVFIWDIATGQQIQLLALPTP